MCALQALTVSTMQLIMLLCMFYHDENDENVSWTNRNVLHVRNRIALALLLGFLTRTVYMTRWKCIQAIISQWVDAKIVNEKCTIEKVASLTKSSLQFCMLQRPCERKDLVSVPSEMICRLHKKIETCISRSLQTFHVHVGQVSFPTPAETAAQLTPQLAVRPAAHTTAALETRSINEQNTRGFPNWLALWRYRSAKKKPRPTAVSSIP